METNRTKEFIIKRDCFGNIYTQTELVRCKDCKHGRINSCKEYTTCFLENSCLYGNTRKSDWFCADGERE